MITRTAIEDITHDDLVNLFSTALYGSNYLGVSYGEKTPDCTEDDCLEDIIAKILLGGGTIKLIDLLADGNVMGELPHDEPCKDEDEMYGSVAYYVTLEDIRKGLEKSANGTFNTRPEVSEDFAKRNEMFAREAFSAYINESRFWDYTAADALMQVILYNEIVYG